MSREAQQSFIYELKLLEPYKHVDSWGEEQKTIQAEHAQYVSKLTEDGLLEMAGIAEQGLAGQIGLVILKVATYEEAERITLEDPAVRKGLMEARIRPFNIYFRPES